MSLADVRAHLLRARAEIDQAIAALPAEDGPAEPTHATIREFASHARVSESTVRAWVRAGLPAVRVGRIVRIHIKDAERWCATGGAHAAVQRLAAMVAARGSTRS